MRRAGSKGCLCLALAALLGVLPALGLGAAQQAAAQTRAPIAPFNEAQSVPFDPAPDRFSPKAWLDLRYLNEKQAGAAGFVRVDEQGRFKRGDGEVLRFWAVNTSVGQTPFMGRPLWPGETQDLAYHARFLAKHGVNLVRLHRQLPAATEGLAPAAQAQVGIQDINTQERDGIWRTVAAMKKEGIYSAISPYWSQWLKVLPHWGLASGAPDTAHGLLFFDEGLQRAYKAWLRALLLPPNPYTGVPLAQDPAVALLQLQNEDSLLFWTLERLQGPARALLEKKFNAFLLSKHGTAQALARAWQGDRFERDQADAKALAPIEQRALLPLWELTRDPATLSAGRRARLADQTEFLARTMDDFNRDIVAFLRDEIKFKAPINVGNWKTASVERLNDVERWTYRAGDVDAVNLYTHGIHQGKHPGWAIMPGDTYTDASALHEPWRIPLALRQSAGRPMLVTEGGWIMPTQYGAEAPVLVAALGGLLGIDGFVWFNTDAAGFEPPRSANGYLPASQAKWSIARPDVMLGFAAAALAFRRGDIAAAAPRRVERTEQDLWQRRAAVPAEVSSFDPNRDDAALAWVQGGTGAAELLMRPFEVRVLGGGADFKSPSSTASAQAPGATRANGGGGNPSVKLDEVKGLLLVDTPRTQAVAGHLDQVAVHRLSSLTVESNSPYASVVVTSLDASPDASIAQSERVLLQLTRRARPTGWKESPATLSLDGQQQAARRKAGQRIESVGGAPWRQEAHGVRVMVRNAKVNFAQGVDANGMATAEVKIERRGEWVGVELMGEIGRVVLRASKLAN